MREIKDFDTEKKIFIGKVLRHIHYKKLHTRIYEEISSHMDDMYEDFSSNCDDDAEITKKVIDKIGNPDELGKELKKANATKLLMARVFKIICVTLFLIGLYLLQFPITYLHDEIWLYSYAESIDEIEKKVSQENFNGGEIKLLAEIEHINTIYRVYVPVVPAKNYVKAIGVHSITVFGIPVKDKFIPRGGGSSSGMNDTIFVNVNDAYPLNDYIAVYFGDNEETYIKYYYEPIPSEEDLEPYWSDFIEVPQDATTENPKWIFIDSPDGYRTRKYNRYNENKELID